MFSVSHAQEEREQPSDVAVLKVNSNRIYGKLIDKNTGKPIEAASVQLFANDAGNKDSLITGMLTRSNGDFSFDNLPALKTFRLTISAIGFSQIDQEVTPDYGKGAEQKKFRNDLGNITLEAEVKQLGNVVVTSVKPALEMGIDRKIFNASKSMVATGGTAIDLMKNIPSVSVDVDGNVTLRNSSPQIFVDGRPTILSLDQIPADNIERVELITNPSAKFDAASSGGIINIVLKKNKRIGLNGLATIGIGLPKIANGNLNLNVRQGKFNFFLSGGYNQSGGKARGEAQRQNKVNGVISDYFNQESVNDRIRRFGSLRLGADYFLDNRNTISITQQLGTGRFGYDEVQDQDYLDASLNPVYYGSRTADGKATFKRNGTNLNFKHNFPEAGKELTVDVNYNYGSSTDRSDILNAFSYPDGQVYRPSSLVNNRGSSNSDQVIFQADYADPIGENGKIEIGLRSYHNLFNSRFDAFANSNGQQQKLPLSNNYEYKEMVNALYGTYSNKIGKFSYQAGLRAEYSKFNGLLVDSAFKFGYEYPSKLKNIWNALFPSLFVTHELSEKDQLQFNYSRRIRRPNFWQLNPFIDINDPANLRQGNPALRPEFVNSFELNYSHNYKSGNWLGVLYFRNNPDDITEFSDTITTQQYQELENAGVNPNAILNTYINAGTTNRYGAEFTVQHKIGKNFDITPTVNMQYRTVKARINNLDLSNEGFNWEAKLSTNYKIETTKSSFFNGLGFQLLGEYESSEVIPQGKRRPQYSVDYAMRKDFLKDNKATITFSVNDVFNTRRWGTIYDTETFYQESYRRWSVRSFRISFSYKFGKSDFSLSNKKRDNNESMD
ncbi:TonB-dependent receptor [Terrimonas sp. NA20]|uniref:TonB-dependent receptor n=1 Tax=Terrimonas ginsenosidimutans TaxID=2908004 RepID=A0ABS9KTT9_9BACT|nr:outer membrane beta-barrel family protein [Terrimonas ginsenosidimutans]MCG2615699.1 TonB-dependent receptor [Terrimonas ginsenosidimutans]